MRSRGTRFGHSVSTILSLQNENFTGDGEDFTKVSRPSEEPNVICGKSCDWNQWTSGTCRSEASSITERTVRKNKELLQYSSNQARTNNGGPIPWNVTAMCETSQIYFLMRRRPMKDVLGNHVKDLLVHLVHWLRITLSLRKISQESINWERKSYLDCSSDTLSTREEFGRMTYWLQTLRSWKRWTHLKSTRTDSMQKEEIFPKEKGEFIFPIADGRIKTPGGDQDVNHS